MIIKQNSICHYYNAKKSIFITVIKYTTVRKILVVFATLIYADLKTNVLYNIMVMKHY